MRTAMGIGALLALLLAAAPASAFFNRDINAPWCLAYSDQSGIVDCGFYSFRQCQETRLGVGGSCQPNPASGRAGRRPVRSSPWPLPSMR